MHPFVQFGIIPSSRLKRQPATITYRGTISSQSDGMTTSGSINFGAEEDNKYLLVGISSAWDATPNAYSSVTLGGAAMTELVTRTRENTFGYIRTSWYGLSSPSQSGSATVEINTTAPGWTSIRAAGFSAGGLLSTGHADIDAVGVNSATANFDVEKGGIAVALAASHNTGGTDPDLVWSGTAGLAEVLEGRQGGSNQDADFSFAMGTFGAAGSVAATCTATGLQFALCGVVMR